MSPIEIPSDEPNESSLTNNGTVDVELKQTLQTIEDKIYQLVNDRPELFADISDDMIERIDHLISTIENQVTQIEVLHDERDNLHQQNTQLQKDIQLLSDPTQTDLEQKVQTTTTTTDNTEEPSLTNRLFDLISNVTSSSSTVETVDNETQTEEQSQDKLAQINQKLKRALQNIKDKINQAVIEQPELFIDIDEDTMERLNHLISTVRNQTTQINDLQNERDHAQYEVNELQK